MARRADTLAGLLRGSPLKVDRFSPPRGTGRQEHRHLAAIVGVFAMESNEVTFLELYRYKNVVVAMAKTRCAEVITGADQKTSSQPR